MINKPFVIYGANGYTGRLITQMAVERGMKPILAGRNSKEIKQLAEEYDLQYEICDLSDKSSLDDLVLLAEVVLHCAGPFSKTAQPMVEACLRNKTHYLDITGEIEVFETIARYDEQAKESKVMLLPGVGFDVVPSDCLANYLKANMPNATHLALAFMGLGGGVSHGTATTMLENLGKGGAIRENGKIKVVKQAYKSRLIKFRTKPVLTATIPWGDVSTAYYSTGIPNIEVYLGLTKFMLRMMQWSNSMGWLLKTSFMRRLLQMRVDNRPAGPSPQARKKGKSYLWGEVTDASGNTLTARLSTPEGYTLTALTALAIVEKVLMGLAPIGFQTPAKAYGHNLILEIKGVSREDLPRKIEIS